MNEKRKCLVGRDDDSAAGCIGFLIGALIVIAVIMIIIGLMTFCGWFIGGYHSIKNYIISFVNNVIKSNRKVAAR